MYEPQPSELFQHKENIISRLIKSPTERQRLLRSIWPWTKENVPKESDVTIVLCTSPKYPDEFIKRVYWASMLYLTKRTKSLIFCGDTDRDTQDTNQAEVAKKMAVEKYNVPAEAIYTAGGSNTETSLQQAASILSELPVKPETVYIVSSISHLVRAMTVCKQTLKSVLAYPHPTGADFSPNPNNRRVLTELVKTILDNRTILRPNNPNDGQIKTWRREQLQKFNSVYKSLPQTPELAFNDWVNQLPADYQI